MGTPPAKTFHPSNGARQQFIMKGKTPPPHYLKGDRKGLWAIDVNKNWRIVFEFKDGNVYIVDYEDYHWLLVTCPSYP